MKFFMAVVLFLSVSLNAAVSKEEFIKSMLKDETREYKDFMKMVKNGFKEVVKAPKNKQRKAKKINYKINLTEFYRIQSIIWALEAERKKRIIGCENRKYITNTAHPSIQRRGTGIE